MVFNSFKFLIFFSIVLLIYHIVLNKRTKAQNWLLLIASYVFYGFADIRMLPLLLALTLIFFFLGIWIEKSIEKEDDKKTTLLKVLGVVIGVGVLFYFKYLGFFIDSFASLFNAMGLKTNIHSFRIIMPLGVSFFTFRLISYVLEVEHENMKPTHNIIDFATYVAFFPCILSGPIDRPDKFLSQLQKQRTWDYALAVNGCMQILWGLFKKMVIADNCALVVNSIWMNFEVQRSSTLLLTALLYMFQIYTDFSGYSDMAIGIGKLLGFRITCNFRYPFFALNISEWWRRWHMSLTTWLTDYVYTPLSFIFRRKGKWGIILAIIINFLLVGMWHEAGWNYIILGLYNGLLFIPLILSGKFQEKREVRINKIGLPVFSDFLRMLLTAVLFMFGMIFARATNTPDAFSYISHLFSSTLFSIPVFVGNNNTITIFMILFIILMLIMEWFYRDKEFVLEDCKKPVVRYVSIAFMVLSIYYFGVTSVSFIYFQF